MRRKQTPAQKRNKKLKRERRKLRQLIQEDAENNINSITSHTEKTKIFLRSKRWKQVRKQVFRKYGYRCMCCGLVERKNHIDHIVPRKNLPFEKWFDICNLQVLCEKCNSSKGTNVIDYRDASMSPKHFVSVSLQGKRKTNKAKPKRKRAPVIQLSSGKILPLYAVNTPNRTHRSSPNATNGSDL